MFGVRSSVKASPRSRHEAEPMALDQRRDFINFSNHRNDLEIFHFDLCSVGDKTATARIVDVQLVGADDQLYAWVVGGEPVTLRIRVRAGTPMVAPIIGFTVRDRSGRSVFGDNSYLAFSESQFSVGKDALLEAAFSFVMPRLPLGDYWICAAIAEGSQQQHVMHDWQPDSLIIRSGCSSAPGDLGLPMTVISLKVIPDTIPANDH